jgi:hypothetical protein
MYMTTKVHRIGDGLQYEAVEYRDGWGMVPVMGSGAVMNCTLDDASVKGRRIHLLTEAEYLEHERKNWPTQYAYRQERIGESMASAGL